MQTQLILDFKPFPPRSIRNCTQELVMTNTAKPQRALDGKLVVFDTKQKFRTKITCKDRNPLFLSVGSVIKIGCIQYIWQAVSSDKSFEPLRKSVDKSLSFWNKKGEKTDKSPVLASFRPLVEMYITYFSSQIHEWNRECSWILEAEEI